MSRKLIALTGLGALLILGLPAVARAVEDRVIGVSENDKAMNQAIADARAKLPHFWAVMAAPKNGESDFCLKVKITEGEAVEHFWCTDLRIENGILSGVIGNDAEMVKKVHLGQRIAIRTPDISDWLYMKADKMIGNYTVRPLMKSMSKEEVSFLKAKLGELPKD